MIEAETLYYFFSTLAQTYGAIVGIIGMLTVFRFQQLNDYIISAHNDEIKKDKYTKVLNGTKDRFVSFVILGSLIIFISISLLAFCKPVSESWWAIFSVLFLLFLVAWSLILTIRLCFIMIENHFKEYLLRLWLNIKEHTHWGRWRHP